MGINVNLHTLGCKANQYDTAAIMEALINEGIEVMESVQEADVFVVNSCTVTASTDRQNRQLIRRLRRIRPEALMVVTGCFAEVYPAELEQMPEVDLVLGNRQKGDLARIIIEVLEGRIAGPPRCGSNGPWWGEGVRRIPGHTRAFVKVQDGCEAFCTYCIVPYARGSSVSRPVSSILQEVQRMEEAGIKEVVLTGIRLGLYGTDQDPPITLVNLLERILECSTIPRIRLSSLEPVEVNDALIGCMTNSNRICPHLHVPLQSGDDEILELMNRPYRRDQYREKVIKAVVEIPDLTLGCDVIVGFPGETGAHFERTLQFLNEIPFTYLHVFTFSPRRGTSAYEMNHRVSHHESKRRSRILRKLSHSRRHRVMGAYVGRTISVLVEQACNEKERWMQGLTPNYLRVMIPGDESMRNRIVPVHLERVQGDYLVGHHL